MSLFLKDTSDAVEVNEPEQLCIKEKKSSEVLKDSGVCGVQPSCEDRQSAVIISEPVNQHKHSIARRCCEIVPSEFESLQIAGDKIRLEERDRGETKPNGIKECHCPRREKQQDPCSIDHLHSKSRVRRRGSREVENSGDSTQCHSSPSVASSPTSMKTHTPRSSLSARERRRQQRRGEIENEHTSTSPFGHLEEEKCSSEDSCSQSPTEDSDEHSNSDTSTASPLHEYEEEEEFLQSLSSTLTELNSSNERESEQTEEDDTGCLEAKIAHLEKNLVAKMGKVQGRLVMKVLIEEESDDEEVQGNWEARLREIEQLVGSKLEPEVASTAWHLHLCYVFQHT